MSTDPDPDAASAAPDAARGDGPRPWRAWLALARPEAGSLGAALVLAAIGSGSALVFPLAIGLLVDADRGPTAPSLESAGAATGGAALLAPLVRGADGGIDLVRLGLVLLVLFAITATCLGVRYLLLANAGERMVQRLRERVFGAVLRQDMDFLDREGTGELTSRLAADCTQVQSVLSSGLVGGFRALFVASVGLALLLARSPELTGVMLLGLPPVCFAAMLLGLRLSKLSKRVQDAQAASNDAAEQRLAQVATVRLLGAEHLAAESYRTSTLAVVARARVRNRWAALLTAAATFGVYAAMGAVLWTGARWMEAGELTPGSLVEFSILSAFVAGALTELVGLWNDVAHARGATRRIEEIATREPQVPPSGSRRMDGWRGDVALLDVHFTYPNRPDAPVLEGLDLELEAGTSLALVGPSGGGKSTIVGLIARLRAPDRGRVTFGGVDADELDTAWLRGRIGVVPQDPALLSGTLEENLRLARPDADAAELARALGTARVDDVLAGLPEGLDTRVGEGGRQLSGGQRQRIALARALLRDPALLILDEATSHLDAQSERAIAAALHTAARGRSVLVVAHRLATVLACDRVAVVSGGRVVEAGAPAELRASGGLFATWLGWQSTESGSS